MLQAQVSLSPNTANAASNGNNNSVQVIDPQSVPWTASSNQDWLTITPPAKGSGNSTINYTVAGNPAGTSRIAILTVTPTTGTAATLTVTQFAGALSISPSSANIVADGGTGTITVSTEDSSLQWTAVSNQPWLTITSGASGVGPGPIQWSAANADNNSRIATITVTPMGGVGQIFTLNQEAANNPNFTVSPSNATADAGGITSTAQVTADSTLTWTATSDQPWLVVVSGSPGSGNGTVKYTAAPNPAATSRTSTITFNPNRGTRQFLVVTQSGGTLVVNPSSANVSADGGPGTFSLTTSLQWSVTSNQTWLTVTPPAAGTASATVGWSAAPNTGNAGRSGVLTITASGVASQTFTVNQAAAPVGTISVNPSAVSVPASISNGSTQVTATANLSWTAATDSPSWLTVTSSTNATGSGVLQFRALGNPTASPRTGTITLTPTTGTSATLVITQAATQVSITPTSASVLGSGGTGSFTFTTNNSTQVWRAVSDLIWLTLTTPASGTADATMSWAAAANPSGDSRTAHITITPDGGSPLVFTVTQQGLSGTITASPLSLSFSYQLLGAQPTDTQLTLTSPGAALPFTVGAGTASGGNWLAVSNNSQTLPAVVNISVNTAGLVAGVYQGTITVASPLATNSPVSIPVTLTVTPAPTITSQPNQLNFSFQKNGPPPAVQTITLATSGPQLDYTIVPDPTAPWLTATGPGPAPSTLTVSVSPSSLQPGNYHATIRLNAAAAGNSPLLIPVSLMVSEAPALIVSPSSLSVSYRQLQPLPQPVHLSVTSSGANVSFSASVSPATGWLSVASITPLNLVTGQTPGDVRLAIDPTGLAPGTYQSSIVLTSGDAGNSPLTVPVTLTVRAAAAITANPQQLTFTLTQGDTTPQTRSIALSSDPSVAFTAAASTSPSGNWLAVQSSGNQTPASLTVTISGGTLAPGTYNGSVVVTSAQIQSPVTIPVTLTVSAIPRLTVVQTQLGFTYQLLSGPPPPPQFVIVGTSNLTFAPVTATVSTATGGNWLFAPDGIITPGLIGVAVDPSHLTAGTYNGTVTLNSTGYQSVSIQVTLLVTGAPALTAAPTSLTFNYQVGSTTPLPPQTVSLGSSSGALRFSVAPAPGSSWITVTGGGQTPATFSVAVNPTGLAAGAYDGSVLVTSAGAANSPLVIPVHFTLTAATIVSANPASLNFTYTQQGSVPASQPLIIFSSQPTQPLPFSTSITQGESWLLVSGNGPTPGNLQISINPNGLIPGHYSASILINAPGAANSLSIPVALTVVAASQILTSPSQFVFSYQTSGELPANQVLTVTSSASDFAAAATAATTSGGNWLTVTGGGTTPTVFSLIANPSGLAPGTYTGSVTLSGAGAGNSPLTIPVSLVVAAAPVLRSAPGQLTFSYQIGAPSPASSPLQITSSGDQLAFQVSAATAAGGAWLSVDSGATTPATLNVTVNPAGLTPGTYPGTISLTSLGGNSPFLIPATLTVSTSTALSASPAAIQFVAQEGGTAPVPQVVQLDSGGTQIAVNYVVSSATPWLTFSGSPTSPGMLTIAASSTGLAAGHYTGVVLVQSDFASNSPLSIPVTFEVSARPVLTVATPILRYNFDMLGPKPGPQAFNVNSSGGAQNFTISVVPGAAWLFASGNATTPAPVSVTVDPGVLGVGEYAGTVLITPSGSGTPIQVQVILTISSAPVLTAQPTELAFAYQINGPLPNARSLVITSDRGTPNVLLGTQLFSGGNWLLLSGGGLTPAAVTAAVNPAGLAVGVYREEILVMADGVANSPLLIPVTLTVSAAPTLITSPSTLSFAGQVSGAAPPNQQLTLTSSDGTPIPITSSVVSNGTWLTITSSDTNTPSTLTIAANAAGLSAGVYQASIVISSPGVGNSPLIIPVTLTVAAAQSPTEIGAPILTVSQPVVVFSFGVGGSQPPSVQLGVSTIGTQTTFQTDVAPGAPWLTAAGSGPTPSSIQISVNPAGLPAGSFHGTILVTSPTAANGVLIVPVDLIVSGSPLLSASPASLTFSGGSNSAYPPQTVQVASSLQSLSFSATSSPATPWLSVTGGGSTPQGIIVSVNAASLSPGTYQGSIQLIAAGAANSPLTIPVSLVVSAAASLQANPSPVNFTTKPGGTPPPPQTVGVTLSGQPATNIRSGVAPGVPWLSIQNASGGSINVVADPAGLLPGTYNGSVVVAADGAANSPLTIPVTLVVGGSPEFDISQESLAFTAVTAQSQPISTTITMTTGQNPPVSFSLSVTASTWLSITPLSGTTPTTSTITVDPTGLRAGNYSGSVIVSSSGNVIRTIPVNLTVADAPTFTVSPPLLEFAYSHGGSAPPPVNVYIGRFGADISVTAATSVPWLTVSPTTPTTSGPIKVQVVPTGLAAGIYQGTILLSLTNSPAVAKQIPVTLYVDQPANPRIYTVSNGMSFLDAPLTPGLIFSIFGTGLGPATPAPMVLQSDQTLSQSIAGVQVLVNGIPCPLLYVSSVQLNAIAPYSLFKTSSARVAVSYLGTLSDEVPVNVSSSSPGLFSFPPTGTGPGAILNQDQSVNTRANPAAKGTIISLFGGGGGQTSPPGIDGLVTTADLMPKLLLPVTVTIGGVAATDIQYAGAAPGFPAGGLQVNVRIPASVASGDLPVIMKIGDTTSQSGLLVTVK
uniref:BACON domain-containing protein n=1 Tax=Solibacter usitatus (strain Ellin6076) TaxID=234267 RepID=Q01S71_SOLUE